MKKCIFVFFITLCCCASINGQTITRNYDNVSLSDALLDLNDLSQHYNISFLYNDLEDFRVSTHIKRKSLYDAIMQVVGFYPIRVVKRGEYDIFVECIHKTEHHLTGTIIDENRQPVPYANI